MVRSQKSIGGVGGIAVRKALIRSAIELCIGMIKDQLRVSTMSPNDRALLPLRVL
jgi:tRNA A37 threonylcarbamoyladenosine dehydratase